MRMHSPTRVRIYAQALGRGKVTERQRPRVRTRRAGVFFGCFYGEMGIFSCLVWKMGEFLVIFDLNLLSDPVFLVLSCVWVASAHVHARASAGWFSCLVGK